MFLFNFALRHRHNKLCLLHVIWDRFNAADDFVEENVSRLQKKTMLASGPEEIVDMRRSPLHSCDDVSYRRGYVATLAMHPTPTNSEKKRFARKNDVKLSSLPKRWAIVEIQQPLRLNVISP